MAKLKITDLLARIDALGSELNSEKTKNAQEIASTETAFVAEKTLLQSQIDTLTSEKEELEEELAEKQSQLNDRELKKLAQAYADQEKEYSTDAKIWFRYSIYSLISVAATLLLSLFLGNGKPWFDRLEYHIINFVTITALVFSLGQFSRLTKLRIDFANRKTIAQAYHNIFSSADDLVIKDKFLAAATHVLCARTDSKPDANTIPEKLLESFTEVAKVSSKPV